MDPADPVREALSSQGSLLRQHDQVIRALLESRVHATTQLAELSQQVARLSSSVQSSSSDASPAQTPALRDSHVSDPDPFFGDLVPQVFVTVLHGFPSTATLLFFGRC